MCDKKKQAPLEKNNSPSSSQPYWQKTTEQTTADKTRSGTTRYRISTAPPVKEASRSSGSTYLSMNASNSTKRGYLERELEKLRQSQLKGIPASQRGEATRQQKNLIHQLNYLDAIEHKKPRSYASEYGFTNNSGSLAPKSAASTGRENTDARQAYNDYLKDARTPSVDEYRQMKSAGTKMSFSEYAHKKLEVTPHNSAANDLRRKCAH